MADELKNSEVRASARELAQTLSRPGGAFANLGQFLQTEIWPLVPPQELGREITKAELEDYLGFGSEGV
jgi:antitoxin VapB